MSPRYRRGARVLLTGGRFRGATGRVTKPEDITTSRYELDGVRRNRPVKAHRKHLRAAPKKKRGWLDSWMPW